MNHWIYVVIANSRVIGHCACFGCFLQYWLSVGAQPSDTVKRILGHAGILPEFVHPLSVETAIPRKDRPKKERKKKKKKK